MGLADSKRRFGGGIHTMNDNDSLKKVPRGPSKHPTPEQGRQGQNIKGMTTVLAVSVALVVLGFVVVFVLSKPETATTDASADGAPVATQQSRP